MRLVNREVIKCNLDGTSIELYEKISIAAKENNISACSITNCCRHNQKSAGGFIWKYKNHMKKREYYYDESYLYVFPINEI